MHVTLGGNVCPSHLRRHFPATIPTLGGRKPDNLPKTKSAFLLPLWQKESSSLGTFVHWACCTSPKSAQHVNLTTHLRPLHSQDGWCLILLPALMTPPEREAGVPPFCPLPTSSSACVLEGGLRGRPPHTCPPSHLIPTTCLALPTTTFAHLLYMPKWCS